MTRARTGAGRATWGAVLVLAVGIGPGVSPAADDTPPPPPAEQATPEAAIRAFNVAVMLGDEATIRRVALPADGLDELLKGQHAPKESAGSIRKFMDSVAVTRAKPGDNFRLPDGKAVKIKPEQVGPDRAVVVLESSPLPIDVHRVKGAWKVDPRPVIAIRRAAGSAPKRPRQNPGGERRAEDEKEKKAKKAEPSRGKGVEN